MPMAHRLKFRGRPGYELLQYDTWDVDGDAETGDDYYFVFQTRGVPEENTGAIIEVRSSGIQRWSGAP